MIFKILSILVLNVLFSLYPAFGIDLSDDVQYAVIDSGDAGNHLKLEAGYKWITSKAEFKTFYGKYRPNSKINISHIDFDIGALLFINMGKGNMGPRDIGVLSLTSFSELHVFRYTTISQGSECIVTMAVTHPYMLIYIKSKQESIQIESFESEIICNR